MPHNYCANFENQRFTGEIVEIPNPFTGEPTRQPIHKPLTKAELDGVREIIENAARAGEVETGDDGQTRIKFRGGGTAEYENDFKNIFNLTISGRRSKAVAQFLYDILVAGNWPIVCEHELIKTANTVIESPPEGCHGPLSLCELFECNSAEELKKLLDSQIIL